MGRHARLKWTRPVIVALVVGVASIHPADRAGGRCSGRGAARGEIGNSHAVQRQESRRLARTREAVVGGQRRDRGEE